MNYKILPCIFVLLLILPTVSQAFGHGLSIDTHPPINYKGRDVAVSAEMLPPFYEEGGIGKQIKVRAFDSKTNENIKNVNFLIGLNYKEKMIFKDFFFVPDGYLTIKINPTNEGDVKINGEKEPSLGSWTATDTKPIELTGPVFNSGGIYHVEIEIHTVDEADNVLEVPLKYDAYLSIGQTSYHDQKSKDGQDVKFRVKSYYDTITNFEYNPNENTIAFEMPFDWSEQNISQIPFVHEEIFFPKTFGDFLAPSYTGQVNGIDLFKSSITVDDYSIEEGRIVHFVILQDHLKVLKNAQKKADSQLPSYMKFKLVASDQVQFPLTALTNNQQFQIDLSWDPIVIQPSQETKFIFTIRDPNTLETKMQSTYDFVILHNGKEIHRASDNAVVGGGFEDFTFSESQTGPIIVRFEKIAGTSASTEFAMVVVPEFGPIAILVLIVAISFLVVTRMYPIQLRVQY
ncbi:MAG: PEFG-CTERM sorting domain-containing protein [Nitrosopumilaceae archaeon]